MLRNIKNARGILDFRGHFVFFFGKGSLQALSVVCPFLLQ